MKKIYHYTTIEVLELILKNSTIRLSSLLNMDDILEGASVDFGDLSKYYYASSWSYDSEESIPLWYMYTNKMRGVRIEADEDFLQLDENKHDYHIENIENKDLIAFNIEYGKDSSFLVPVIYIDSIESSISNARGIINYNFYDIGRIKPTAWKFQNEVRFRFYGVSKKSLVNLGDGLFMRFSNTMINGKANDIAYADLRFDINRFRNANFMLGPSSSYDDYSKVERLVEIYIPGFQGNIQRSELMIRYKEK